MEVRGSNNGTGFSSRKLDSLLDDAEHTIDRAKLKQIFKEIQAYIADEVVTIPTTSNVSFDRQVSQVEEFRS